MLVSVSTSLYRIASISLTHPLPQIANQEPDDRFAALTLLSRRQLTHGPSISQRPTTRLSKIPTFPPFSSTIRSRSLKRFSLTSSRASGSVLRLSSELTLDSHEYSAPSSFSEFIKQFGKKDGCTVVDLSSFTSPLSHPFRKLTFPCTALPKTAKNDPVLQHIALLVRTLGVYQSVKRIYLVGIHPMSIKEGMRMLGNEWDAAEQAWMSTIFPKLVLFVLIPSFSPFHFPPSPPETVL